ncbi:MAG5150 family histidine triad lipoprotein [Mycoplasma elephantis]|uniref:MAG5150 family histidine triad lipoprotein n=1 Tax=Mycoplasma elephantis TaxID=114882 RepID=UPI0004841174|nr:hypothetical protein [Mycoplasma elephantis]
MLKKTFILSLSVIPVMVTVSCGNVQNTKKISEKTTNLKKHYNELETNIKNYKQTHFPQFANNNGNNFGEMFLNEKKDISKFINEVASFSSDIFKKIENLQTKNWEFETNIDKNSDEYKLFAFWFPTEKTHSQGMEALENSETVINDAKSQINEKISTLLNENLNSNNKLNDLANYFKQLGENEEVIDKDLQTKIKDAYSFLKEYLYNRSEDYDHFKILEHEHNHEHEHEHENNHSGISSQHNHSHAILNIIRTSIIENKDLFNNYLNKLVDYYKGWDKSDNKFMILKNKDDRDKVNDLVVNHIIPKYNELKEKINLAETEMQKMIDDFDNLLKPLKSMCGILKFDENELLL